MSDLALESSSKWYVIQTKPRQEFRAFEQLENQAYTCFLPTLSVQKIRRDKLEVTVEPLFSRYLFIRLNTVDSNWSALRSTRGVSRLIAFGGELPTVPDECIDALRQAPTEQQVPLFQPGERVRIATGALAGLEGIYQMADGEARAMVLIELLCQPQKIKLGLELLRKAA